MKKDNYLMIRIDSKLLKDVKQAAEKHGLSMSSYIRMILTKEIKKP